MTRRAAKQMDRQPATRQIRRNYNAAATRMRRQAHTSKTKHVLGILFSVLRLIGRLQMPLRPGLCAVTPVSPTPLITLLGCTLKLNKLTRGIKRPETPAAMQTKTAL